MTKTMTTPPNRRQRRARSAAPAATQYRRARVVLVMLVVSGLSACAGLGPFSEPSRISTAEVRIEPTPRPALETRRFPDLAPEVEVLGAVQMLRTRAENTLSDLARRHDVGYQALRNANPEVDPWLPGDGTPVYLPTMAVIPDAPRDGIVINLPSMRLLYFERRDAARAPRALPLVVSHPVGIGREGWETPTGAMHVTQKTRNPTWHPPASVRAEHAAQGNPLPAVVPPGPDNPLGLFRLRLSRPSYLIHGTNKPAGVGMRVSHGCIQLYPEDIEALFDRVALNTPVHIVDQPVLAGWRDGVLYLEVHPPLAEDERDLTDEANRAIAAAVQRAALPEVELDAQLIAQVLSDRRGLPVPILAGAPTVDAYLATARLIENLPAALPLETSASR